MAENDAFTDWADDTAPVMPPQCSRCVRRTDDTGWSCEAFPGGIPVAILVGAFDHTRSYPGDNGLRFKPERERGADDAA